MAIITRITKGSALTHAELDNNFVELRDGTNLMIPKTKGKGIKLGPFGNETFGWHDLHGNLHYHESSPDAPTHTTYRGGIEQHQFAVDDAIQMSFHLPHDYAPNTDIFIHVHWSHTATNVTGGSVTWGFELIYAKGHNQAAFGAPINIVEQQNASIIQYQHMVCEAPASIAGGDTNLFNTADIEVDALIFGKLKLVANDITVSGGGVPNPFVHTVDIHYQSTSSPTKNRSPDFWA